MNSEFVEESPGFLLWQVAHYWQRQIVGKLKTLELTHVQFALLAGLQDLNQNSDGLVTQVQLSRYVHTDVMMTSKVVRKLEDKNLIRRQEHPTDTRAKALEITEEGKQLLQEAKGIVAQFDREFFSPIQGKAQPFTDSLAQLRDQEEVER